MPQTLLVTGPGGAGRTTVAATTALAAARDGRMGAAALRRGPLPRGARPRPAPGRPDRLRRGVPYRTRRPPGPRRHPHRHARRPPLGAEELTELPGAEQFALLRALRRAAAAPDTDLVVVDMPPLPQAVATLALPAQLRRYLARLLPAERQAARALRPVLAQLAGVPMPAQWLYEAAARWDEELAAVQAVVEAATTAVRLVAEPGPAADATLRTGTLGLALHELSVLDLVANRLVPRDSADPWVAGIAARQDAFLTGRARDLPVVRTPHLGRDPEGPEDLELLAATPGMTPAPAAAPPMRLERRGPARRRRGTRLGDPAARRPQERARPDPARGRTRPRRGPAPQDRSAALGAAPLHRLRRRPRRRRPPRPLHPRPAAVAPGALRSVPPFGYRRK